MGVIDRYADRLPVGAEHASTDARRGQDAARHGRAAVGEARRRALLQVRGHEPDRLASRTAAWPSRSRRRSRTAARASSARRPGTPPRPRPPTRARAGLTAVVLRPAGAIAAGKLGAGARRRRAGAEVRRQLRRRAARLPRARRARRARCSSTRSTRTGSRGRRRRRSRSSRSSAARPTCSRCPTAAAATASRTRKGFARGGRGDRARLGAGRASARRRSPPRSASPSPRTSRRSTRSSRAAASRSSRSTTPRSPPRGSRSRAAKASSASRRRRPGFAALAHVRARARQHASSCVLTGHGLKDTGARSTLLRRRRRRRAILAGVARLNDRRRPRRRRTSARASTAPAPRSTSGTSSRSSRRRRRPPVVLEGEGADELPRSAEHLALRAFALVAPVEGHSFRFVEPHPARARARLVRGDDRAAASSPASRSPAATRRPTRCSRSGLPLEGHADNLAPAVFGGVCLSWRNGTGVTHTRRLATDLPLAPIVVVPDTRVNTEASRGRLPASVVARRRRRGERAGRAARRGGRRRRRRAARGRVPRQAARAVPRRGRAAARRAARRPGARHGRRHALRLRARRSSSGPRRPTPPPSRRARRASSRRQGPAPCESPSQGAATA